MQEGNVGNQREHLILLLANVHIRQFPKPDQQPKVCPCTNFSLSGHTLFLYLLSPTFVSSILSPRKKWFELIGTTCYVYLINNFIWSYWVLFLSINYTCGNLFTFGNVTIGELPPVPPLWSLHCSKKAPCVHNQWPSLPVSTTPISSIAGTVLGTLHQSSRCSRLSVCHCWFNFHYHAIRTGFTLNAIFATQFALWSISKWTKLCTW